MEKTKSKPQPGDLVEVSLVKTNYRGTLLESPEPGIILIKLDSGYNIGLNKRDIVDIKILKKSGERKEEKIEIKKSSEKPNIAIIMTGGTISSSLDPKTGAVKWLTSPEKLFKFSTRIFFLLL
jgi:glutamyl-tRNA(Gln) amidotransferase subunit D